MMLQTKQCGILSTFVSEYLTAWPTYVCSKSLAYDFAYDMVKAVHKMDSLIAMRSMFAVLI